MPDEQLDTTELEQLVHRILDDEGYTTRDIQIEPVTTDGANYTTILYKITVTSPEKDPLHLFSKVANLSNVMRDDFSVETIFKNEINVYERLFNAYDELQAKHNVPEKLRFRHSRLYGKGLKDGKEMLVFGDLTKQGYVLYDRFQTLDWENAAAIVSSLARYHALSFALEREEPELFEEFAKYDVKKFGIEKFIEQGGKKITEHMHFLGDDCKKAVTKFVDTIELKDFILFFMPVGRRVVMHGDYRTSNIMFKKEKDQVSVVPVDFQITCAGCIATDLLYLTVLNTDEEFRRKHWDQLVDLYHEELAAALKRMGIDVDQVYPRSQLDFEIKKLLPYSIYIALTLLPLIMVDGDSAPNLGDKDVHMSELFVPPCARALQSIEGYIRDLIRWGALRKE